ncbi:unnamed protein product [Staurois parvus]|uniref:Uncharacterized protein n=1 Tax=Staurois parvus TaxID=386267 RepID=A0ABN9A9H2_9NEOB|nr:unnamed protein product [Staurois parvus]
MLLPDSSTLLTVLYQPPLSANPSTDLHLVSSTPLYQSLHWLPFSVLHPSLPIPLLASTQCPPSLSANPSTGFPFSVLHPSLPIPPLASHSVSSTPLCQSLHWLPI